MASIKVVSALDLTVAQVETIELQIGVPVNRWGEAKSLAALYVAILSAANGEDPAVYRAMTMRELIAAVTLDESDPTPPSGP